MAQEEEPKPTITQIKPPGFTFGKAFAILGGAGLAVWGISTLVSKANAQNTAGALSDDVYAQWASSLKNLIEGYTSDADIENMITIAGQITDWKKVVDAYAKLTGGKNLESDASGAMGPDQYTRFLRALQVKGRQTSTSGNVAVQNKNPRYVPGTTKVLIDSSKEPVQFFKNTTDYPAKPYVTLPKGSNMDPKGYTYWGEVTANYVGSSVTVTLYQISLSNGTKVWINRDRFIKKTK
jgi:hypothetical protein